MAEPSPGAASRPRSLLARLSALISSAPEDRDDLLQVLREAHTRELLGDDALAMIEGVMRVPQLTARDIMVPRPQIDMVDLRDSPDQVVAAVIQSGHSRLPATDGDRDNICGILHAKDLLRLGSGDQSDLRALLRPAMFIPESKRVDVLLREFRLNRYHLAVVVDEYGGVSGMVTIEDVLEQIVGEIEDEFDEVSTIEEIVSIGPGQQGPRWRVHATTDIYKVNAALGTALDEEEFDTLGGLVVHELGRVPLRGETLRLDRLVCEVLRANARQVQLLIVELLPEEPTETELAQEALGRPTNSNSAPSNGR